MKFSAIAFVGATVVSAERKFTDQESFMTGGAPAWYANQDSDTRMESIKCRMPVYFDKYFEGKLDGLRGLFEDNADDIEKVYEQCGDQSRQARAVQKGWDPCTSWVKDDAHKDFGSFVWYQGLFVRENILKAGGARCEFLGRRILTRLDRLNGYLEYAVCDKIDRSIPFCSWRYFDQDGNKRTHPRNNSWFQNKFDRPTSK